MKAEKHVKDHYNKYQDIIDLIVIREKVEEMEKHKTNENVKIGY